MRNNYIKERKCDLNIVKLFCRTVDSTQDDV